MDEISAHGSNGTPINIKVNEKSATAAKKVITLTIKDRFLIGLEEAAKEKHLTLGQYITESLENTLIKEGKLPEWWHTRQF